VAALTVAFPISPVVVLLAHKYAAEESDELASALVLSVVLSIVTLTMWLTLTSCSLIRRSGIEPQHR
jgi:hypothetical protein